MTDVELNSYCYMAILETIYLCAKKKKRAQVRLRMLSTKYFLNHV